MSDALERLKTYEEGLRDGFLKGQEKANKVIEQMLHTSCNPIACTLPETEAIKLLEEQNKKLLESCEGATMMYKDLCKAKELIKKLMHELVVSNRPYDEVELLVIDVEQFLNSEVDK